MPQPVSGFSKKTKEEKIEYDGNPIRLDYTNDGKLLLGNNLNSIPEAWIVTVQKIYKDKKSTAPGDIKDV